MGVYIPNIKPEQFYELRKQKGIEIIAVPVPPHGRLGDLDALHKLFLDKAKKHKNVGGAMVAMAALCIANAPTVIPAEKDDLCSECEGKARAGQAAAPTEEGET